jgi:hypothetical protein
MIRCRVRIENRLGRLDDAAIDRDALKLYVRLRLLAGELPRTKNCKVANSGLSLAGLIAGGRLPSPFVF